MPGPRRSDDDDVTPPEWTCPACGRSGPLEIGEQLPNDTLAYCHHTPDRPLAAYLAPPDDPGGPARRVRTGAVAGLVLLHVPLASALAASDAGLVRAVLIDGSLITGA